MIFAPKSFLVVAAQTTAHRATRYSAYTVARREARACGYQFPSFNEWCNGSTRNDAEHRATLAQQLFDDYGYVD
jgi:hypothetical protein